MYATLADILEQVDQDTLILLTDDTQAGTVDETAVDRAVANGAAVIDAHCGNRYVVPFGDPVPALVRLFAVDLAVYNLYSRRTHVDMPDVIGERQKQVLAHLRLVQQGKATIGKDPDLVAGSESNSALVSGNERIFTRKTMRNL